MPDLIRAGLKRCGSLRRLLGLYVFSESGHGHAEQPDRTTTQPSLIAAYADQAAAAGLTELAAMSASWLVLAFWSSIRSVFDRAPVATATQALVVTMAIAGWL